MFAEFQCNIVTFWLHFSAIDSKNKYIIRDEANYNSLEKF